MLLLNYKLSAPEALKYNFVSELFTLDELDTKVWPKIQEFTELSKESICVTKRLMKRFEENALMSSLEWELVELRKRFLSPDAAEAVIKFMSRKSKL